MTVNYLDDYDLIYEITCLPNIIYAEKTKASQPICFSHDLYIPKELAAAIVECRFSLYHNKSGRLIELSSNMLPASKAILNEHLNRIPLEMIKRLGDTILNLNY